MANDRPILYTLLGLNRAGGWLWSAILVLGGGAFLAWHIFLPSLRFSDADERLFRAARHGDRAGVEQALSSGAGVNDRSPLDGRTVLSRAAAFGHADLVRMLLEQGADPSYRGDDGRTALEIVASARTEEKDPSAAQALDAVALVLREPGR